MMPVDDSSTMLRVNVFIDVKVNLKNSSSMNQCACWDKRMGYPLPGQNLTCSQGQSKLFVSLHR